MWRYLVRPAINVLVSKEEYICSTYSSASWGLQLVLPVRTTSYGVADTGFDEDEVCIVRPEHSYEITALKFGIMHISMQSMGIQYKSAL